MLVSLISYSQSYPITKIIGRDSVVIISIKQAEQINTSYTKLNDSIKYLDTKSLILNLDKAQGYALVEAYDREYKRASLKIENLNLEIENRDNEIIYLKRRINKTIFQSIVLVIGWTLYVGIKSQVIRN